jgi:hypothetical protein
VLSKERTPDVAPGLAAGTAAIAAGVAIALVAAAGAPELTGVGHVSVFVGMALSLAGLVAGRPQAHVRASNLEVRSDAHR